MVMDEPCNVSVSLIGLAYPSLLKTAWILVLCFALSVRCSNCFSILCFWDAFDAVWGETGDNGDLGDNVVDGLRVAIAETKVHKKEEKDGQC